LICTWTIGDVRHGVNREAIDNCNAERGDAERDEDDQPALLDREFQDAFKHNISVQPRMERGCGRRLSRRGRKFWKCCGWCCAHSRAPFEFVFIRG
jgi:hypothetical protein